MRAADLSRARGETRDSLVSYPGTPTSQQFSSVGACAVTLSLITTYNYKLEALELH